MSELTYRSDDGARHRVLVATVGGHPVVLDVDDGHARLVDRLDAPGEGLEAAAALAVDYCRQCAAARRPLHGAAAPGLAAAQLRRERAVAA